MCTLKLVSDFKLCTFRLCVIKLPNHFEVSVIATLMQQLSNIAPEPSDNADSILRIGKTLRYRWKRTNAILQLLHNSVA